MDPNREVGGEVYIRGGRGEEGRGNSVGNREGGDCNESAVRSPPGIADTGVGEYTRSK